MRRQVQSLIDKLGYKVSIILFLVIGVYQGIQVETFILDLPGFLIQIVTVEAIPAAVTFSIVVFISGSLLVIDIVRPTNLTESIDETPNIVTIIPAYQVENVLHNSISSLKNSTYSNFEIFIVTEPDDPQTINEAKKFATESGIHVITNRYAGSKAGAINDAVERIDAEYYALLDADEQVDPAFLTRAITYLTNNQTDIYQARRVPRVTGAIEALAYCERILFHAAYRLIEPLGFTYCRSSSVAFTKDAFETVDGFDNLVTEDIDFAHKCFRAGLTVQQERDFTTEMEAPHTVRDLWGQRKRWRFGQIELFLKAIRGGYDNGGLRGLFSTGRIISSLIASVFLIALTAKILVLIPLGFEFIVLLPLVLIELVILPLIVFDYRKGHIKSLSPGFSVAPLIYPGLGILTIRCAFAYATSWDGSWYHVKKTG